LTPQRREKKEEGHFTLLGGAGKRIWRRGTRAEEKKRGEGSTPARESRERKERRGFLYQVRSKKEEDPEVDGGVVIERRRRKKKIVSDEEDSQSPTFILTGRGRNMPSYKKKETKSPVLIMGGTVSALAKVVCGEREGGVLHLMARTL